MILPVFEVQDLIDSMNFADVTFVSSIDEAYLKDVKSTIVLITEATNELDMRSNNRFRGMSYAIEVQIFYGTKFTNSVLDTEIALARLLEKNDWITSQSKSHTIDPKTDQVTKVFYFTKKYILED
ncbi:DUF806 family protein [Weissella paramesenteroides]|uniref:DUF806 family protein n=1 Tax=Weissella paramesenteroides TaxID=1249 RepID=UPI003D364848